MLLSDCRFCYSKMPPLLQREGCLQSRWGAWPSRSAPAMDAFNGNRSARPLPPACGHRGPSPASFWFQGLSLPLLLIVAGLPMSSDRAGRPSVLPVECLLGTMLASGGPGGQLTVHKLSRVSEQGRAPGNILAENLILMNQLQEAKRRLALMGLTFGNTVFSAKTGCFFKMPCLRQFIRVQFKKCQPAGATESHERL